MLNELALFAGIGGIPLALRPWCRTVCYVEINPFRRRVLRARMAGGQLDWATIENDVEKFDPRPWAGKIDIITAGFPCQDISAAGGGAGLEGKHSRLFWEVVRIAALLRAPWLFLENSPLAPTRIGLAVAGTLAQIGYLEGRTGILSAEDVGARHLRERWWARAHRPGTRAGKIPAGPWPERKGTPDLIGASLPFGGGREMMLPTAKSSLSGPDYARAARPRSGGDDLVTRLHRLPTGTMSEAKKGSKNSRYGKGDLKLTAALHRLPTGAARDTRSGKGRKDNGHSPQLPEVLGGKINPDWEELFFGYPPGWTDPERLDLEPFPGFHLDPWGLPYLANGMPDQNQRIAAIGDAVVPEQAREAFARLMGIAT